MLSVCRFSPEKHWFLWALVCMLRVSDLFSANENLNVKYVCNEIDLTSEVKVY